MGVMGTHQRWQPRGPGRRPGTIRVAIAATAVVLGTMAGTRGARADEHIEAAWAWGLATSEVLVPLGMAAVWKWGSKSQPVREVQYASTIGLGVSIGLRVVATGENREWNPTIGLATHGVMMGGLDGFLIGGLLDGVAEGRAFSAGPLAFGMAGAGALAAGWAGATAIEPDAPTVLWLAGPALGAAGGVLLAAVPKLVLEELGHDLAARRVTYWCIASGAAIGILSGLFVESDPDGEHAPAPRRRAFLVPLAWQF